MAYYKYISLYIYINMIYIMFLYDSGHRFLGRINSIFVKLEIVPKVTK